MTLINLPVLCFIYKPVFKGVVGFHAWDFPRICSTNKLLPAPPMTLLNWSKSFMSFVKSPLICFPASRNYTSSTIISFFLCWQNHIFSPFILVSLGFKREFIFNPKYLTRILLDAFSIFFTFFFFLDYFILSEFYASTFMSRCKSPKS